MTVASETNRSGPYNGNGVTTVFDYEFRIVSENHVKVIKANAAGVETILVIDADYIVSDVGNPAGGQVALTVPLPTGYTLTLLRDVPFTQETDLQNQGAYYAETIEAALDLSAMRDQELQEQINRAVTIPPSEDPAQLDGLVHDVLRLADSADNIDVVAGNIADVVTAADNITDVVTAADNIAAIIAAPGAATAAAASATAAAASASAINLPAPVASTFLQRNAGNTAYDTKAAADVRLALTAPVYGSRAQMIALDTAKDALVYVTDFGNEAWYKWTSANLSSRTVIQTLTTTLVNAGTDTATVVGHALSTGSGIVSTQAIDGLALNTVYYVIRIDADTFKLAATPEDAYAGAPVIDLTGGAQFTFKHLRDPLQDVYVIKPGGQLDGTAGAWVKSQAAQDIGISKANYHRFNDRLLVGLGATGWMGDHSGPLGSTGVGSWLGDEIAPGSAYAMSYLLTSAQVASVTSGVAGHAGTGIFGASRSPDGATNQNFMGGSFYASGHGTSLGSVGWGLYVEAVKRPGSNTTMNGFELEITNLNSTPVNPVATPEATYVQGRAFGMLLASGGGNVAPYDADWALAIGPNGAKFRTGLVFFRNGLTKDAVTNIQHAIQLPDKARQEWFTSDATGNYGFTIHGDVSDSAHSQYAIVSDAGFAIANVGGANLFRVAWVASAVNSFTMLPGATGVQPVLLTAGSDANVDFIARGKGSSGGALQDGASSSKIMWNVNGVGFGGTVPRNMTGWSVDTGTAKRTANATYSATAEAAYTQATIQALMDKVRDLSQTIKAMKDDLHQTAGYGLLRT